MGPFARVPWVARFALVGLVLVIYGLVGGIDVGFWIVAAVCLSIGLIEYRKRADNDQR